LDRQPVERLGQATMTTKLGNNRPWNLNLFNSLTFVSILAALFSARSGFAQPSSPIAPVPEEPPIYHEGFDEAYFAGYTNAEITFGSFEFDESFSGYALTCVGETVFPS
jgi:hypothetical protein